MSMKTILDKINDDPKLKEAMETLQLTPKSFRLMPLFPMIYIAWADGKLQQEEVDKILEIAEENDLTEGDGAGILSLWLKTEKRPSDEFFVSGLRLTAAVLKYAQTSYKNNLVELCESVAEASGGAFGVSTVSGEEKKALVQIAELLDIRGQASYHTLIERMQSELSPEELDWMPSKVSPAWIGINTIVSLGVAIGAFMLLRTLHKTFVVSELHQSVFLIAFMLLPQVGFFLSNVLTARMSAGNTIRESTIGSGVSIVLVMIIGAFVIGSTAKKYQGFNVRQPDPRPLLFPQCDQLKPELAQQRCIREAKHKNATVCRLLPNASAEPAKYPMGKKMRDWFPAAQCKGIVSTDPFFVKGAKNPKMYQITSQDKLISKGYYPLCTDLASDAKAACIAINNHPKEGPSCQLQSNPATPAQGWGKKYKDWFPKGTYCAPVYARTLKIWKRAGQQTSFLGHFPACDDIKESDQHCVYLSRVSLPGNQGKKRVCVLSSSRLTPLNSIPLASEPYHNWFPLEDCQQTGSGLPLGLLFAALGFAVVAIFSSFFGGWVGERWQGTV
jgi:hypothetical protein